jgi:O-acetyl-ADP-ribose deacetylase (regulator of RNase III)
MKIVLCDEKKEMADSWRKEFSGYKNIEIRHGNILEEKCDAIVSPANSFGFMDGGFDYQLREFFGKDIEKKLQKIIKEKYNGEILVGQAEIIRTGNEKIPYMISAPTMRAPMELEKGSLNVYLATKACYNAVKEFNMGNRKINSIAFTGMGTGVGRFPHDISARQMRCAYDEIVLKKSDFPNDFSEAQKRTRKLAV